MISVICPVFNEEDYIEQVLDFFIVALPEDKEMIVVDGGSTDKTVEMVEKWQVQFPSIRLAKNPDKYVPYALNKAISIARGDIIIRLDAHTKYALDYFLKVIESFNKSGASIVGGPMRAGGNTSFQKAVSYATSTLFGIGNSRFHFEEYEGFTDSVYLGAWKKEVFAKLGGFDEEMLRNQDDEFNYRASKSGMKIYQDPAIRSLYFPRNSYKKLFRQYYEYGLFKPLVLKKVSSGFRLRHIIPSFFALYLLFLPVVFFYPWLFTLLLLYALGDLIFTVKNSLSLSIKKYIFLIYPVLHFAYGIGFIIGLKKIA